MRLKNKKHILLPVALGVYTAAMAVIGYPHYKESDNMREFGLILGICLALPFILHLVLKRREKNRDKFK